VSISGRGYLGAPGIYSEEQITGWRDVTEAIHAKGGYIFAQLWHVGRVSHVDMTNCEMPVAHSVVPFEGTVVTRDGFVSPSPHRALRIEEIPGLVEEFRSAALNAKAAGFDGVEIHGANGYILDQFLQDGTNKRTDSYGGPIENRARLLFEVVDVTAEVWGIHAGNGYLIDQFMNSVLNTRTDRYGGGSVEDRTQFLMEVVEAAVREVGPGRVGVRLSPFGHFNSMPADPSCRGDIAVRLRPIGSSQDRIYASGLRVDACWKHGEQRVQRMPHRSRFACQGSCGLSWRNHLVRRLH
jgi:2,4-dienoyl-CoA reductase-like NADH-dependent reductase (Old Yellow Enzyme family)